MIRVKNSKGMMAQVGAAAITEDHRIAFLSIAGALAAVKAIWASVVLRRSPLQIGRNYRAVYGDRDVEYLVLKQGLAPGLHHWVMYPEPNPAAPYLLLVPLNGTSAEKQLVRLLNQHSLWPVRPQWEDTLWGTGTQAGLIQKLKVQGDCLPWAYAVSTIGWDDVIGEAAKAGSLTFSNGGEQWHA
jgi:hypothetical protein